MHVCAGINALLKLPLLTCIAVEIPVGHTAMIIRPDFNMHYHPKRRSILCQSYSNHAHFCRTWDSDRKDFDSDTDLEVP